MKKLVLFTLLLTAFNAVSGRILNVPDQFPTIQAGIDSSANGDTVLVAPGTYHERINFNGHNIVLGSYFLTTSDPTFIETTIIEGYLGGSVVKFENGNDSTTVLCGFVIKRGHTYYGAVIICSAASPIINNNIIFENTSPSGYWGGGLYIQTSSDSFSIFT